MPRRLKLPSILIVDDEPDNLVLGELLLTRARIQNPVIRVIGGEAAKEFLRQCCLSNGARRGEKPGLVLLDVNMPSVSGFQVLRWLKQKKAFRATKVLMWSSSLDERDRSRATELGADGFFTKFPNAALLGAAVRACLAPEAVG